MMPEIVRKAKEAHERASKALVEATIRAYPVGTIIEVTLGNARVTGRVTGSGGYWWYNPGTVTIVNLNTNSTRRFSATHEGHDVKITSRPGDKQ